jgi:hypothetical protein
MLLCPLPYIFREINEAKTLLFFLQILLRNDRPVGWHFTATLTLR